jgi:transcription antitermination factor NusA-like protein
MTKGNDLFTQHLGKLSREYGCPEEQIKEKILEIFGDLLKERYPKQTTVVKWEKNTLAVDYEREGEFFPLKIEIIDQKILGKIFPLLRRQLREGKSAALLDYFKGKERQLFHCKVTGSSQFGINIEVDDFYGLIRHGDKIPGEEYTRGQTLLCLLKQVDERGVNTAYFTRRGTDFIRALMEKYIPDVAANRIDIMAMARIDGVMAKVVVDSQVVNPVGACMGPENFYRNQIMDALGTSYEKLKFVEYHSDPMEYLVRTLGYPESIRKVDIRNGVANVECEPKSLRYLIGKGASNVRLATFLQKNSITSINLLNPEEYQEKINEFNRQEQENYRRSFLEFCGEDAEGLAQSLDLFLQTIVGQPSNSDIKGAEQPLANKMLAYYKHLRQEEIKEFYEAGGNPELIQFFPKLPIELFWKLKTQKINSLKDILEMGDARRLAEKCSLTQDVAMLIFNSVENAEKK